MNSIRSTNALDLLQNHVYGNMTSSIPDHIISTNIDVFSNVKKPFFTGEFGMDSGVNDKKNDPKGLGTALHNSIWASLVSGSFSTTMNWWWAGYINAKDLYPHFRAFRDFTKDINWDSSIITLLNISPLTKYQPASVSEKPSSFDDVSLPISSQWGDTRYKEFSILNNGDVKGGIPNYYLHGRLKPEFKINPRFHLNYPSPGTFSIHVGTVSQGAELIALIDGKRVLTSKLPVGPGKGLWKSQQIFKKV